MEKVTAVVPTYNEESKIGECLESLRWADELVVVDSYSTDATVRIARNLADRVELHRFEDFSSLKNRCVQAASHRWVLLLDADERATPRLRGEIRAVLSAPSHAGYWIPRVNHFLGRRIRRAGWGGQKVLRLFERDRGRYTDRAVHERLSLDGDAGYLTSPLLHYPYESLDEYWRKSQTYARMSAQELFRGGRRGGLGSLLFRPGARFLRMYLLQMGILDGAHGLLLSGLAAVHVYAKYARLWELSLEDENRSHRHGENVEGGRGAGAGSGARPHAGGP
jgi:glycosyltransferase involved in cell wall biosynthesis